MGAGMGQTLLFPDPKPLDQRLGKKFFRRAPRRPGMYLMKDASDKVLYLGKAKDLKASCRKAFVRSSVGSLSFSSNNFSAS